MGTLYELVALTFVIHLIDTLAYAVRLNAAKSGQFALSTSLFNVFVLVSRTANMLQGPLIGTLIGVSIATGSNPIKDIRFVIFSSTIGTLAGIVLIPSFLKIFSIAVHKLEETGSVPAILLQALNVHNIKRIAKNAQSPSWTMLPRMRYRDIPKRLLVVNTFIIGVYTVGVLAAFYAATLVAPEHRLSASASSGMINGIASILLTLFVDPYAAIVTDQTLRGTRPIVDLKSLVILLLGTKVIGTLLGQLLFIPSAQIIANFYK